MISLFIWIITKLCRNFTITGIDGSPYLDRFFIIHNRWFGIYLHHILRSDEDRELHDHPWKFTSIILRGSYMDCTPEHPWPDGRTCRRFSIIKHKADDLHRLVIPDGQTTWSLVFRGRKCRDWGFMTKDGWVHNEKFLDWKFGKGNWVGAEME